MALLAMRGLAAQEVTAVWSGPTEPVPAGARVEVWLNCLNTLPGEAQRVFAGRIQGRIVADGQDFPVALELATTGGPAEASIAPNAFVRRAYWLALPLEARGRVVLELAAPEAGKLALEIAVPATTTGAEAAGRAAATEPEAGRQEDSIQAGPVEFFKRHLFPYEPFYFIAGPQSPNAKFQISLKYRLFDPDSGLGRDVPPASDLYLGYTQTSLWDWQAPSAPFLDTSYKPELLYYRQRTLVGGTDDWFRLDLQGGFKHESNGRDGEASRSMNIVYARPTVILGYTNSFQVTLSPRAWFYVGDLSDNPDIVDYRGYADLLTKVGWSNGLQLGVTLRGGADFSHGSLQLDLSFPMRKIPWLGLTWYVYAQYFTGYGESFLLYKERSDALRFGFSLYR